ncbi:hypothetical protein RFI_00516 [Reticulomyxa filosa]|uniref:Uncharacterized protein n=1 Tax=Reticulomyxa filosa TaxID=46433 RepID=X6PDH7_RETFI|nr:hypothetical protein RFI_00516 [Reticulomyxa filosa]|eukprot:ETO36545.1 hypothetical protein RFI_00516 [Reticulomyxa filosa]
MMKLQRKQSINHRHFKLYYIDVNEQQLIHLAQNFNDGQMEQKDYRKTFAAEQKKKREETVTNPEISNTRIKRLHKMPIVKVLLSKTEDVVKILKYNDIQIGYSVKVESFDKRNYEAAKCRHKNNPSKHKCILCRKQHPSDSLQCDLIRKAREKLDIKLTSKEDAFLKKKASQPIKSNVSQRIILILMLPKDNGQMEMKLRMDLRNQRGPIEKRIIKIKCCRTRNR